MTATVGETIARFNETTHLDIMFRDPVVKRWRIPRELATRPTVAEVRRDPYLMGLPVVETARWSNGTLGSGWDLHIDGVFEPERMVGAGA